MADDVNIVGVSGLPSWATEDTLSKIQTILQKTLGLQNSVLRMTNGGLNPRDVKELSRSFRDTNKASKENLKLIETDNIYKRKGEELYRLLGTRQALLATTVVAATKTFDIMKDTMVSNVKTFDQMFKSGIMVVDSAAGQTDAFKSLGNIALLAGLRIEKFSQVMENFAGANAIGAIKFAKTLPVASRKLLDFGFDIEAATMAVGAYLDTVMGTTDVQSMSAREIAEGAAEFGKNLARLSMATGISREKLMQQAAAINSSIEANALAAEYGDQAAQKMSQFAASFSDPDIGNAFVKMMSSKLPILNTTFQNFAKAGLGGLGMQIANFSKSLIGLDPDEAALRTKMFVKGLGDLGPMINQQKLLAEAGVEGAEENLRMLTGMQKQQRQIKELSEADLARQMEAAKASAAIKTSWERIVSSVQKLFAPSVTLLNVIGWGLDKLADMVVGVVDTFDKFDKMIEGATSSMGFAWKDATATIVSVTSALIALSGSIIAVRKFFQLMSARQAATTAASTAGNIAGGASSGAGKIVGSIGSGIGGLGKGLGELLKSVGSGGGKMIHGLFSGISAGLSAFANPKVLLGSTVLSASIAVLSVGLGAAAYVMGKTLPTLAEGLSKFSTIDGSNLIDVGKGIMALSAGLALFGAGSTIASAGGILSGLINNLGGLFGVDSPLAQMQKFADIGDKLQIAGQGVSELAKGLREFSEIDTLALSRNAESLERIRTSTDSTSLLGAMASWFKTPESTKIVTEAPTKETEASAPIVAPRSARSPGSGIESSPADTGINSLLAEQTNLISQLLIKTDSMISVNRDILKYTKLQA